MSPCPKASTRSTPDNRMSRADEHAIGPTECGEADTEGVGDIGIELVGNRAADVVRLDDLIEN